MLSLPELLCRAGVRPRCIQPGAQPALDLLEGTPSSHEGLTGSGHVGAAVSAYQDGNSLRVARDDGSTITRVPTVIVIPRSRAVAEAKLHIASKVHGHAGFTRGISPIAIVHIVILLRHAASPVVIHAASTAVPSFSDGRDKGQCSDPN